MNNRERPPFSAPRPPRAVAGILVAIALATAHPTGAALHFGAPQYWPAGSAPAGVVLFDADLDGALDAVTADAGSNSVSVLAGDGAGGFLAPVSHPTGAHPVALAAVDFDADGDVDLVTADSLSNTASVLFGAAGAAFDPPIGLPTGPRPTAVAMTPGFWGVAPGIVTANAGGTITHFEGDGERNFFWRTDSPAGSYPGGVVAGDFVHDGMADVAAVDADPLGEPGRVTLLTAQYEPYDRYFYFLVEDVLNPSIPRAVALAEITANGWYDLVVASGSATAGTISIRPGDGQTPFLAGTDTPLPAPASALAVADLDGDDDLDVAAAGPTGAVMVLLNDGGTLALETVLQVGEPVASVAAGDVDQDDRPDLVVALRGSDRVAVLRGGAALAAGGPPAPPPAGVLVVGPQPARESAVARFRSARPGEVSVEALDCAGRLVRELYTGWTHGGDERFTWDLRAADGRRVASGTYLIRARGPAGTLVGKVAVVR